MQVLKELFKSLRFEEQEIDKILACFKPGQLERGEYFASEGKHSPWLAFIEKGVLQYFYNQDGKEITTYVVGQNGFAASLLSFLQKRPAQENIRAVTDAELWLIHKNDFDKLKSSVPGFKDFYISILEHQIVCIDESRFSLLTQSAEERYTNLLEKEPQLLQQLPLQFLASTLGITPRHLSRIRNKIR
ncbi:MAG: Crp/Fnr family transcriptional regulator [Chitinophagaceae bacterium]|nr:Crp/Fnr family transcriptional regulator [Chitinophagaceae bacterium]